MSSYDFDSEESIFLLRAKKVLDELASLLERRGYEPTQASVLSVRAAAATADETFDAETDSSIAATLRSQVKNEVPAWRIP